MLDYKGIPIDSKKQTYSQAFAIYAFSEYFEASADRSALFMAIELLILYQYTRYNSQIIDCCKSSGRGHFLGIKNN